VDGEKINRSEAEMEIPNVIVEWLTLLFLIRDVPGLNLGPGDQLS
jgi:hypothetical protein